MATTLTRASVEKLKPIPGKRRVIRDGASRSLYLVIHPTGSKSWLMRFRRPGGAAAKIVLGPVDLTKREGAGEPEIGQPLSLVAARQLAAKVHSLRATGRDVVADHKASRHRQRIANAERSSNSFAFLARKFIEEHARPSTRRWQRTARLIGLSYSPDHDEPSVISGSLIDRWADRLVSEIDAHDAYQVIDEARRLGIPGLERRREGVSDSQGRAVATVLSRLFSWLVAHRKISSNPFLGTYKPPPPKSRDRVLTSAEIAKLWVATDQVSPTFAAVVKLLLITGARLNEIASLRWEELSEDATAINIPGDRTKNGRAFVIPLPPIARGIVAGIPRIDGCPFAFTTNGRTVISGWGKVKRRLDATMGGVPPWRLHDLRRTAATMMAEIGVAPHIVEACLNHLSGARASVAGVYNRAAYADEKKAALERWANHLTSIVSGQPARVVSIRGRRR
jgi:integrase